MIALDKSYKEELKEIIQQVQTSDHLKQYLDEEAEEFYNALKDEFEPALEALHLKVAESDPLQLIALEQAMLDTSLEGLFLPRLLGYSVLRGAVNDQYKYLRPQEHFKDVLMAICNSFNFEILSQRIGQTVEVGFALSSDIWITNLLSELSNKQVIAFLESQKDLKYRDVRSRHTAYVKYTNQFKTFNFLTANMPESPAEVTIESLSIINFILYRASLGSKAEKSLYAYFKSFIENKKLASSDDHLTILLLMACYFDFSEKEQKELANRLNEYADNSELKYFEVLSKIQEDKYGLKDAEYDRLNSIVDHTKLKDFKQLLSMASEINKIGYINTEAIELCKVYYYNHQGLSIQNECLRGYIFQKINLYMSHLAPTDYPDYFEINKTFTAYMNSFDNEKFNQEIKNVSLKFVRRCMREFIDKRSKDYQDIKKFVSSVFVDLKFLKDKEVKDLFKTKRKRPVVS